MDAPHDFGNPMMAAGDRDATAGRLRRADGIFDPETSKVLVAELRDACFLIREGAVLYLCDFAFYVAGADLTDARVEFVDRGRMWIPRRAERATFRVASIDSIQELLCLVLRQSAAALTTDGSFAPAT